MSEAKLHQTRIQSGVWEGVFSTAEEPTQGPPEVQVLHQGKPISGLSLSAIPGRSGDYALRFAIPAELLSEGVQTFLFRHKGETLATFAIVCGVPLDEDIRVELDCLRAELDALKRAFRRQFQ